MASDGAVRIMGMESSSGEESYARHSRIQNRYFHLLAKPELTKALEQLRCSIAARTVESVQGRNHIAVADLGCSYGPNTLECAEFILGALQQNWADKTPEIQYFFSDLPSNDFNALFQSLQPYLHGPPLHRSAVLEASHLVSNVYVAGVPGSFHGRLFPQASLHLVICSHALHWLSQVPPSLLDKSSSSWNGGHTWITNSSQNVLDAYAEQSKIDVMNFLRSRAQELASGGILFLVHVARPSNSTSSSPSIGPFEVFDCAWREMVNEGIITMDEFDMFNMPMHFFNEHELVYMVKDIPELKILHMEIIELNKTNIVEEKDWINTVTSGTKPMVDIYLGEKRSRELYKKFQEIGCKVSVSEMKAHDSTNMLISYLQKL